MFFYQALSVIYIHLDLIRNAYDVNQLIFLFFFFSFAGWMLEAAYRSFTERRIVNPGFLKGPFVPIYGFSGIFVLLTYLCTMEISVLRRVVIYFTAITCLEYATGNALYRIFRKRYWDYSKYPLNVGGHVCLWFSVIWTVFSLIGESTVYPASIWLLSNIPSQYLLTADIFTILMMQIDIIYSTGVIYNIWEDFFGKLKRYAGTAGLCGIFTQYELLKPERYRIVLKHNFINRFKERLKKDDSRN